MTDKETQFKHSMNKITSLKLLLISEVENCLLLIEDLALPFTDDKELKDQFIAAQQSAKNLIKNLS
jgi:hypothetical protein